MRILARALGDPQTQFPSVLIAGTNGKGSTAATLSSILAAAGLRTGLYTSPHLTRVTERIRLSAPSTDVCQLTTDNHFSEIPEEDFARLYFQVDEAANRLVSASQLPHHPSFFETLTALAFLYFAEQKIDVAILEVGLGGRLDATNIVEPILSVITDIALDHQEYLGNTLTAIAREKAGILRPNGTLITLPQHPEANQAIGEAAIALNVRAISAANYLPSRDAIISPESRPHSSSPANHLVPHSSQSHRDEWAPATESSPSSRSSSGLEPAVRKPSQEGASAPGLSTPLPPNHYDLHVNNEHIRVRSPLPGEHQRRNIALAITAAIELRNYFGNKANLITAIRNKKCNESPKLEPRPSILDPSLSSIELGIAQTDWPGRLEFLPPNLLLDVAHNPAGAWTLRAAIASLPETQPRTLIFSCLRDKDLREMAQILFPLFDSSSPDTRTANLILTPINSPRAASLDALLAAAHALDIPAHPAQDPAEALALARQLTPANGLIFATGSIYLIGALRDLALSQA